MGRGRTTGCVVVEVFDQALHGDVRNPTDHVEVVPVEVPVDDEQHLPARFEDRAQTLALLHEGQVRSLREPTVADEVLVRGGVVHQDDGRESGAGEVGLEPLELRPIDRDVDVFPLVRRERDDMNAPAVETPMERSVVHAPKPAELGCGEVDDVVVAGDVEALAPGFGEQAHALGVARAIRLGRLVLEDVAEVDDEVGAHFLAHATCELGGQRRRVVAQLS